MAHVTHAQNAPQRHPAAPHWPAQHLGAHVLMSHPQAAALSACESGQYRELDQAIPLHLRLMEIGPGAGARGLLAAGRGQRVGAGNASGGR